MRASLSIFAAMLLWAGCSRQPSTPPPPPARPITIDEAVDIALDLPEVRAWSDAIGPATGGVVHIFGMPMNDDIYRINGREYWSVYVGEDHPDHVARKETFLIRLDGKEILVEDCVECRTLTLAEWRKTPGGRKDRVTPWPPELIKEVKAELRK